MRPESAMMEMARLGFRLRIEGEAVKVRWEGQDKPDPSQVAPLLEVLKANKEKVRDYLARTKVSSPPEHILTCFECPHFETYPGPNPRQAWGKCLKRKKGRFGCATACEKVLAPGPKEASNAHLEKWHPSAPGQRIGGHNE